MERLDRLALCTLPESLSIMALNDFLLSLSTVAMIAKKGSRRVQRFGTGCAESRNQEMEQAWCVCAEPAPDLPYWGERELALALVDGANAWLGRLLGRPHESIDDFLLVRIEMPALVDLNELGIHVSWVEDGTTHPTAIELHGKGLPDCSQRVL